MSEKTVDLGKRRFLTATSAIGAAGVAGAPVVPFLSALARAMFKPLITKSAPLVPFLSALPALTPRMGTALPFDCPQVEDVDLIDFYTTLIIPDLNEPIATRRQAYLIVGDCYLVENKDIEKGLKHWEMASQMGYATSSLRLAQYYDTGNWKRGNIPEDSETALKYFRITYNQVTASNYLKGIPHDEATSLPLMEEVILGIYSFTLEATSNILSYHYGISLEEQKNTLHYTSYKEANSTHKCNTWV